MVSETLHGAASQGGSIGEEKMTKNSNLTSKAAREYRSWVRRQAGLKSGSGVTVRVVSGDVAPALQGESGHYTTPGGKPVYHPNAYRRAWGKPVYHCTTERVEVGEGWLLARGIPLLALQA